MMKQITLLFVTLLLSACGLKGPLTLPTTDSTRPVTLPTPQEKERPQDQKATQQPYDDITGYA